MSTGYQPSTEEEQIRAAQLATGPGRHAGQLALNVLQHASITSTPWPRAPRSAMAASSLLTGSADTSLEADLRTWLHPHEQPPSTEKAQRFRASLEEALLALQWQELALENGYLPLAGVQEDLYAQLRALLGSAAVQQYVVDRNFQLIWRLVRRVGLTEIITARNPALGDLLSQVPAPRVETGGQVRFASFLSQYRQWREDPAITVFRQISNEQVFFDTPTAILPEELIVFLREGSTRWLHEQSSETSLIVSVEKEMGTQEQARLLQATDGLVGFVQGLSNLRQIFDRLDSAGLALFFTS